MKHGFLLPRRMLRSRGMTLVEAVMAMLIVSVMLLAALNLVGASRMSENTLADQNVAQALAENLMAEILDQAYADPVDGVESFGRTSAENNTGNRSRFDDVDDYHTWSASPPQTKDGTELDDYAGWSREVVVEWVEPADLTTVASSNTGIKRITITVSRNDRVAATLTAYRTSAWQAGREESN